MFVYGSCVARDIIRVAEGHYGLSCYVARQSWISAASKSLEPPKKIDLSPFSARSLRGDFASNAPYLIRRFSVNSDVFVVDIASERHGVYKIGGSFLTNSGELRRSQLLRDIRYDKFVPFGSKEHRGLFRYSVAKMKRVLVRAGVFERVLVLDAPFAGSSDDGSKVPLARGLTAPEINAKYKYYYTTLRDYGFEVLKAPPQHLQLAASEHKWGLQQDHYIDELYFWWAERIDEFADGLA